VLAAAVGAAAGVVSVALSAGADAVSAVFPRDLKAIKLPRRIAIRSRAAWREFIVSTFAHSGD
jgi:hypothetical protein